MLMNGTCAVASASISPTVLPPLMLVRSASVRWVGIDRSRLLIICTKAARSRCCRRGLRRDLGADRRVAAPLVVVRRVDEQRRIELEQLAEQAVVERLRVAGRQIGAAGAADQQRVAGEDAILADQAHRVGGVAGRVQHLQAQLAEDDRLAVVDAHRDPGRRAGAVHHGHRAELLGEPARRREVVGVGVGVDDEADAQAVARRQREVAIDLAHLGIDQRAGAGVGAADEVRLAAPGGDLLEDHSRPPG